MSCPTTGFVSFMFNMWRKGPCPSSSQISSTSAGKSYRRLPANQWSFQALGGHVEEVPRDNSPYPATEIWTSLEKNMWINDVLMCGAAHKNFKKCIYKSKHNIHTTCNTNNSWDEMTYMDISIQSVASSWKSSTQIIKRMRLDCHLVVLVCWGQFLSSQIQTSMLCRRWCHLWTFFFNQP